MPIETICQRCGAKLRVKDHFAGSKARCPKCKAVYIVPGERPADADLERWRLKADDGEIYGPATRSELDEWFAEGRITPTCSIQREGDLEWRAAAAVYPSLLKQPSDSTNPFRDEFALEKTARERAESPFAIEVEGGSPMARRRVREHRGTTIIVLGMLGLFCCSVLAPIAWIMGHADLKDMDAGVVDASGRGTTQAGMVLGIIGCVWFGIQVAIGVLGSLGSLG